MSIAQLCLHHTLNLRVTINVGEHPLVVQLLKGIFNSRPPAPRYTYTWDVSTVTSYLERLGPNEQLSLKQLSRKLLAITSAEMGSELVAHDLRFKRSHPEGVSFNLPERTEGVRVGKPLKTSFHSSFQEISCFVHVHVLKIMKCERRLLGQNQFLNLTSYFSRLITLISLWVLLPFLIGLRFVCWKLVLIVKYSRLTPRVEQLPLQHKEQASLFQK